MVTKLGDMEGSRVLLYAIEASGDTVRPQIVTSVEKYKYVVRWEFMLKPRSRLFHLPSG